LSRFRHFEKAIFLPQFFLSFFLLFADSNRKL
jgi:hypothetical protein